MSQRVIMEQSSLSQRQLLEDQDYEFEQEEILSGDQAPNMALDVHSDSIGKKSGSITHSMDVNRLRRGKRTLESIQNGSDKDGHDLMDPSRYTVTASKKSMHKILSEDGEGSDSGYSLSGDSDQTKRTTKGKAAKNLQKETLKEREERMREQEAA